MKQQLNEVEKLQKIAGIAKEAKMTPFYELGFKTGPNGQGYLDNSTKEGQIVSSKVEELYNLLNDKDLIEFAKGFVHSVGARSFTYEGLNTVAEALLSAKRRTKDAASFMKNKKK